MAATKPNQTVLDGVFAAIPPANLHANPWNKRRWYKNDADDPGLRELADSIDRSCGNIERVVVRELVPPGEYQIVCGERRVRAVRLCRLINVVHCEIRQLTDAQAFEYCMEENKHRENLHPLEESDTIQAWLDEREGWGVDEVASQMGISRSTAVRRLQLSKLTPAWREALYDPQCFASSWAARLLERVASLPAEAQDRLLAQYREAHNTHYLHNKSYAQLAHEVAQICRTLDGVPWPLDEGSNPCAACHKRSSCQPDLWDDVEDEPDDVDYDDDEFEDDGDSDPEDEDTAEPAATPATRADKCLDSACFESKMTSWQKLRLAELRAKAPGLVVLHGYYDKPEDWMGDCGRSYDFTACKKNTPGAVPTIRLADKSDKIVWMTRDDNSSGGSTTQKTAAPDKTPEEVLADKRANLAKLRAKMALSNIMIDLDGMVQQKALSDDIMEDRILPLVFVSGTNNNHGAGVLYSRGEDLWADIKKAGNRSDLLTELLYDATKVIIHRLRAITGLTDYDFEMEGSAVCAFFRLDYEPYIQAAIKAKPEPKSWKVAAVKKS